MIQPVVRPGPFAQRLGVRLALALALSLLPLGIISGLQSRSLLEEAQARTQAALLGETLLASARESSLIRGARVTASALAATIYELRDKPEECSAAMRRILTQAGGTYSYAVLVPPSGLSTCTSNGTPIDLSDSPRLERQKTNPNPDVVVISQATQSKTSVLAFGHPLLDDRGGFLGYVSVSMPHSTLDQSDLAGSGQGPSQRLEPIALITFDADGVILTSSTGFKNAPARLPAGMDLGAFVADNRARTFAAMAADGNERIYAVFPLVDYTIFAIGSWPIVVARGPMGYWVSPYLMPGLMWLASLLVGMLAAERLVTRHIRTLRASITAFAAGGHWVRDIDVKDAAVEIRDVADAYLSMTDTIMRNEAELENMVNQREVLLREVHHRVKNNLQLIASIMNMQMRQSHSVEAKTLMKGLQDRVMSLATIHRGLYQTSGLADVRADELLSDIARQILKMATGPGRVFDVVTSFDDLRLTPDQAVPLSLLLTEALTNAIKYAGSVPPARPRLEISVKCDGTDAVLTVSNSVAEHNVPTEKGTGLGSQLMTAFAQQLGAESAQMIEDGLYTLRVKFPVRVLVDQDEGVGAEFAVESTASA